MDAENSQFCVNIFCVMPNNSTEATCPKDLFRAHECCKENGFNVNWIQEEACMKLKPCKEDVFILSEFVGSLFEFLRQFKCTVIGPQCLLVSVNKGEPLPDVPTPVFTVAMKGIIVTTTGCTPQEKKEIQEKVQFMGGLYSSAFSVNVTHLIVKSVADFSLKFKVAINRDIPVMIPNWVDAVWNASLKESVHGTDPMFARYACPPFQGLVICVSQIPIKDREALKKIIEANGGRYSGQLEMGKTNILITTSAEGEKYTYARRWKIRCLKPEWIHTSLNKGYAVDPDTFIVEKSTHPPRCSTPEADHSVMKFGNSSINSTILNESRVQHIDETVGSTTSILNIQQCDSRATEALETLDLAISKKAGPFLDGCKVFISGFDGSHMEKLRRILNNAGVARFNSISESLSHVIVGKTIEEDWKQLQQLMHKPHVVTVEWVAQSLRLKRAAPEGAYLHPDFKNVIAPNKENASKKPMPEPSNNFQEDSRMVQQYLTTDHTEEEEVASLMNRPQGIFSGLTFQLLALDTESTSIMTDLILSNGGRLVAKNGRYVVTEPVSHAAVIVDQDGTYTVVNTLWIEECVDEERLVDIENYHRHIKVRNRRILEGYTVSFSGIQGRMRELLDNLIVQLGGRPQETFSRKLMEEKNVYRSTHLVCAKTEGRKYEKALEWGVPAVSAEWVIACAISSTRPNEEDYPPTGEPVKLQEPEYNIPTPETVVRPSRQPAESVVLKTSKQKQSETPSARRLPPHFDMSSPHTPMTSATPTMPTRPAASDTPTCLQQNPISANQIGRTPQARPALFNMPTPDTPYGRLLNTDPSPDTRKMWKHALENRVRLTPRADESINVTPQDIQKGEIVVSSEASDYFESLRKKLRLDENGVEGQAMWNTEEEHSAAASPLEPPKPPFHGVVAFIHKKVEDQRTELVKAVETLGGRVRFQHCEEVTHFVYQGKLAASKEIRSAKEWHQKFVSPQWILDCEDASCRLEESQYPPSLNPKMALSLNFNSQPAPPSSCTQKRRLPANSNETNTPRILSRKRLTSDGEPRENDLLETNEEQINLVVPDLEEEACKELLKLDQVLSRSAEQIPLPKVANVSVARNGRGPDHVFVPATQPLEMADSQSAPIVWDLHETQKPTGSQRTYSQHTQTYRVMFSGMALDDRDSCTAIIEELGGTVLEANQYDPTCTHLVVAKVGSNEKLLTSIAAGKWILHPEWLSESEKEKRFLEEPKFEWGNPEATVDYPQSESITEDEANIAAAAYYWRINRSRGLSDGPFHGITAVLYLREKNASFQRLLEAGGGKVVDQGSALENKKTNLCILDSREAKKLQLSLYANRGIYCVPLIYLRNLVLATDKKLKWSKSVLPEFLPYLENMPSP